MPRPARTKGGGKTRRKQCSRCGKFKNLRRFRKDRRKKWGVGSECRDCHNTLGRKWGADYRERHRDRINYHRTLKRRANGAKPRLQKTVEERLAARRASYRRNYDREKNAAASRRYRARNRRKVIVKLRIYRRLKTYANRWDWPELLDGQFWPDVGDEFSSSHKLQGHCPYREKLRILLREIFEEW